MKKFVTLFLVLALAGAMTTNAMAAPDAPAGSGGTSQTEERVLIIATAAFGGQVRSTDDGTEPEFDPEYPMQQSGQNAVKGTVLIFKAKADEGYKFVGWQNDDTGEMYSTDDTITITAEEAMNLTAVFEQDVETVLVLISSRSLSSSFLL